MLILINEGANLLFNQNQVYIEFENQIISSLLSYWK